MIDCEMCRVDFFTSTPATTTRTNRRGRAVHLCETCARVEFDGLPLRKKPAAKPTNARKAPKNQRKKVDGQAR